MDSLTLPLSKNANSWNIGQEDAGTGRADQAHLICWVQHSDRTFCCISGINVSFGSCEELIRCDVIDSAVDTIISFRLCFSTITAVGSHRFPKVASLLSFVSEIVRIPSVQWCHVDNFQGYGIRYFLFVFCAFFLPTFSFANIQFHACQKIF